MKLKPEDLVLYQDQALLVVNKPAGLPTLVDGYDPGAPYLVGTLKLAYDPLWVVHRLDRYTSGVIVFARSAEAHRALNLQFEKKGILKIYHALVEGDPVWNSKTVRLPLRPDGDRKHRTIVDSRQGKRAVTEFDVLQRYGLYTLIKAIPRTGRTHQIRVHLREKGYSIVGDELYGGVAGIWLSALKPGYRQGEKSERPLLGRLGLHAWSLSLIHPITSEQRSFEASYPKDFANTLKQLSKYCTC